jgi:hypothetical protein
VECAPDLSPAAQFNAIGRRPYPVRNAATTLVTPVAFACVAQIREDWERNLSRVRHSRIANWVGDDVRQCRSEFADQLLHLETGISNRRAPAAAWAWKGGDAHRRDVWHGPVAPACHGRRENSAMSWIKSCEQSKPCAAWTPGLVVLALMLRRPDRLPSS